MEIESEGEEEEAVAQPKLKREQTNETATTRSTRRRRTKQTPSSLNKLQVYNAPIELCFD